MKTLKPTSTIITGAAIILFAAFATTGCSSADANSPKPESAGVPVKVTKLERERISLPIHVSGNIEASKVSRLSFKTGGIVKSIFADAGESVKAGQILAKLDLQEIQEQVNQATIGMEKAQRDYERVLALYQDTVATLEQIQNMKSALDVAQANFNIAQYNLKFSTITAPSDGVILKKFFEEDEIVNVGMPIFYFASVEDSWHLLVGISDKEVSRITLGDNAKITTDAFPEKELDCTVSKIGNAPGEYTGLYEVELTVNQSDVKLKHGFFAKGTIETSQFRDCYSLPIDAIQEGVGHKIVFFSVDNADGLAMKQETEMVLLTGDKVYIDTRGFNDQMLVIIENQKELKHLNRVRILENIQVASIQ